MFRGFKENLVEVLQAVLPITSVVVVLQFSIAPMPLLMFIRFLLGALMVMLGLLLFLQGVKIGLLPMGEMIGAELPKRGSLSFVLLLAFVLGFIVTVAEPDVRVLARQIDLVSEGHISRYILILAVALGVGMFVCMAVLRIILNIPIAYLLAAGYLFVLVLSFFTPPVFVPIAFDSGVP